MGGGDVAFSGLDIGSFDMEHDIYASIDATDGFQFYGGITNFTDQKPALGSNTYPATALGRFFYVGAKVKLPKIL